ncbi:MAG: siderophore-interacting protein [Bacteroidota bacterium]
MPSLPKWIANGTEVLFRSIMHPVEVSQTEYLDDELKRVRFFGDLDSANYIPGQVVEFRVNDTEFRHYTPAHYDQEQGICDVLFYLHDFGPGSQWADALTSGDTTKLMGPGGKMQFQTKHQHHFIFGDESSLGLCAMLKSAADEQQREYLCLLELNEAHRHWPELVNLQADVVAKSDQPPAQKAVQMVQDMQGNLWDTWQHAIFYLTGRAQSIQAVRRTLVERGVGSKQIITFPYWADGKTGL